MGTEAYVYAGHLNALARDLDVPVAAAGQIAAAFALTYAVCGPILAGLVSRFERRSLITTGLFLIALLNVLAALAQSLSMLMAVRIACGVAAGLVGPITSIAAAELAPVEQRGRAMAVVLSGMTLAFVLGIPAGSVVGEFTGWRGTFAFAAVMAAGTAVMIRLVLPTVRGGMQPRGRFRGNIPSSLGAYLILTLTGFASTFTVVAYYGPVVTAITGITGAGVGAMQAFVGVGSLIGIIIGGCAADRKSASTVLAASFFISAFTLAAYTAQMLNGPPSADIAAVAILAATTATGAAALFARAPIVQTKIFEQAAPQARPLIIALNGSMVFFGQGIGAAVGGATISASGLSMIGVAGALIASIGGVLAALISISEQRLRPA
ncbi:MAG: MFS transporter [Alphaproteobacteria bacterium]|nr:MFS transporter [Alphaproteobacteria bacterium]